jgi:hypothetical protein
MALMAAGRLAAHVGKTFIESLALMARTLEVAYGSSGGTLHVVGLEDFAGLATDTEPPVGLPQEPLKAAG